MIFSKEAMGWIIAALIGTIFIMGVAIFSLTDFPPECDLSEVDDRLKSLESMAHPSETRG